MRPDKLNAIFLCVAGAALLLGAQWALTPGHLEVRPPALGIVIAAAPLLGLILLVIGLVRLYKASK